MSNRTVTLHRVFTAKPDKVYRAFTDADALTRWLPPHGFTAKMHSQDLRVGGRFRMSFTNFTSGTVIKFGGEYLELVPGQKLRYTDVFDDPNLPGVMTVTVTLTAVSSGTDVLITQEGIPEVIPLDACYVGWQQSLSYLANLVEPEIPG
jgi:uncharacterized protein YndB with AHSA1/START domain